MSKKKSKTKKYVLLGTLALAAGAAAYYVNEEHTGYKEKTVTVLSKRGTEIPVTICRPVKLGDYPLVLFLHGFMGSKDASGRFSLLAEALAKRGIASARLDFAGCGDSKEPFANYRLKTALDDVDTVYQYMKDQYNIDAKKVALVGHSMGGRIAALFAETHPEIRTMAFTAPALTKGFEGIEDYLGGKEKVEEILKEAAVSKTITATTSFGATVEIGSGYFMDMMEYDVYKALNQYTGKLLYLQGNKDTMVPAAVSGLALQQLNPKAKLNYVYLDHMDHGFGAYDDNPENLNKYLKIMEEYLTSNL